MCYLTSECGVYLRCEERLRASGKPESEGDREQFNKGVSAGC